MPEVSGSTDALTCEQVVQVHTIGVPSLWCCLLRAVVKTLTWFICGFLFGFVFCNAPGRALHDQLAGTVVVKRTDNIDNRIRVHGVQVAG